MNTEAFVQWIETLQHQLSFRESILMIYCQTQGVRECFSNQCDSIIQELEVLKQSALSAPTRRDHQVPANLSESHYRLSTDIRELIAFSAQESLIEGGYVDPQVVTKADVELGNCCMKCGGQFVEGESSGTLVCTHTFHLHCITRWLEVQAKCPFCALSV
ncbi:uncharacterized protein A4U43_C07F23010 [Asparagus officinalis]|uniref:RING-type E3 ubiquitin transferase n=1 Tax=Asparagus officinalis TaxID=4686 RepID=A0A5P1EG50_ASPOF|nr:uncharacterized protein A4U43_C07F23010 [Asparagus officinalis]